MCVANEVHFGFFYFIFFVIKKSRLTLWPVHLSTTDPISLCLSGSNNRFFLPSGKYFQLASTLPLKRILCSKYFVQCYFFAPDEYAIIYIQLCIENIFFYILKLLSYILLVAFLAFDTKICVFFLFFFFNILNSAQFHPF